MPETTFAINPEYPQPPDETFKAWREARDPEAGMAIIQAYGRFVTMHAHRLAPHIDRGVVDIDDLFQSGYIAVLTNARRFDPEFGNRFLTYAARAIAGSILTERSLRDSAVSLPFSFLPRLLTYRRLAHEDALPSTNIELAEVLSVNPYGAAIPGSDQEPLTIQGFHLAIAAIGAESLEVIKEFDPNALDSAYQPSHPNVESETEEDHIIRHMYTHWLIKATFTPEPDATDKERASLALERKVICRRYGLTGEFETYQSLEQELGVSKGQVKVLEKRALARLRNKAYRIAKAENN